MLHRAKKKNPDAVVVAVGCYVQTGKEEALKDASIDLAVGNNRKKDLIPILEEFLAERDQRKENPGCNDKTLYGKTVIEINRTDEYESMMLKTTAEHTRAFIKIQDGCNQFCSYCIIPYARGRVRSRKEEEILEEVRNLAGNGYKEVVITGIHISSYGLDFDGITNIASGENFPHQRLLHLIKRIHEVEGIERIRLGSLEPRIITEEFARELSGLSGFCPHFHLSLQSGCDTTLKRMNRKYNTAEYEAGCDILRKYYNNPAITTDVIVGFPQETEEEFEQTVDFLKKIHFFEMHIFKYSRRKGTVADRMDGQVPDNIKNKRSDILIKLEEKMSDEYRRTYIGNECKVLFEEQITVDGNLYYVGHTDTYVKVCVSEQQNIQNRLLKVHVSSLLSKDMLFGEIVND